MKTTRLTQTDLKNIETEVQLLAGPAPTLADLQAEGYQDTNLTTALDRISGLGRIATLLIAELIQAAGALIIGVVFAILEYWRVFHGAEALNQSPEQAALIAFAVVVANVVHPIYHLRQLRGKEQHEITKQTGRGYLRMVRIRIFGKPTTEQREWTHNPVLDLAALVITLTTVVLAVYDLIEPILTSILKGTATDPMPILIIQLVMGLGLSLAGVFFLQAAAHEIGVRTLTDQPERAVDVLAQRRADHRLHIEQLRSEVRERYMEGKVADQERKERPFGIIHPGQGDGESGHLNGHANGHGGTKTEAQN